MTTESTATESVPANGATKAGELLGTGKPGTQSRSTHVRENVKAGRDAIKAEFEAAADGPKPAKVADAPAKDNEDEQRAKDRAAVEKKDEPADVELKDIDDAETEDGEDEKPAKVEDKPDSETAKRLASVQAAEKRMREKFAAETAKEREALAREKAEAAREREELKAVQAELAAYKKAVERAKVDPVSALKALGVDDLDYAARTAYAASKGDPANKEAAARLMREREQAERLERLEAKLAERERQDAEREQHATIVQRASSFMDGVKKAAAAGEVSPLAKHFLAKDPEHTERELRMIAKELADELQDIPEDPADVLARFEKKRRADLARYGVDPDSLTKTEQKKPDPEATKKTVAKTLGNDLSTTRVPQASTSEREQRRELRAQFESGKLG